MGHTASTLTSSPGPVWSLGAPACRLKREEVDCGDVELAGEIVAETEVGDNSVPRKIAEPRLPMPRSRSIALQFMVHSLRP